MVNSTPPPPLRDRKLDLDELQRLARAFDGIGDEIGGARSPAVAFVRWLADEYARYRSALTPARRGRVTVEAEGIA